MSEPFITVGGVPLDRWAVAVVTVAVVLLATIMFIFGRRGLTRSSSSFAFDMHKGHKREEDATDNKSLAVLDFRPFKVSSISQVSHNVKLIRFALPANKSLDLPIGRHLSIRATVDKNKVIRAYTPTTLPSQKGYFELLVKVYEHGKLSRHLHSLKVGDTIEARGPIGRFQYTPNKFRHMSFLVGGSGITPAMQVIRSILVNESGDFKDDKTIFTVFYQNRTVEDILLREDLEELQAKFAARLRVVFFLSNPGRQSHWSSGENPKLTASSKLTEPARMTGYIDEYAVSNISRAIGCDFVGVCGPSAFNEAMKKLVEQSAGHSDETIYMW